MQVITLYTFLSVCAFKKGDREEMPQPSSSRQLKIANATPKIEKGNIQIFSDVLVGENYTSIASEGVTNCDSRSKFIFDKILTEIGSADAGGVKVVGVYGPGDSFDELPELNPIEASHRCFLLFAQSASTREVVHVTYEGKIVNSLILKSNMCVRVTASPQAAGCTFKMSSKSRERLREGSGLSISKSPSTRTVVVFDIPNSNPEKSYESLVKQLSHTLSMDKITEMLKLE